MVRTLFYFLLLFVALDEPANLLSAGLFANGNAEEAAGFDDVSALVCVGKALPLHDSLPLPSCVLLAVCSASTPALVPVVLDAPEHRPLRC